MTAKDLLTLTDRKSLQVIPFLLKIYYYRNMMKIIKCYELIRYKSFSVCTILFKYRIPNTNFICNTIQFDCVLLYSINNALMISSGSKTSINRCVKSILFMTTTMALGKYLSSIVKNINYNEGDINLKSIFDHNL